MPRNVWNDIVSWQTRRLNNSTKYLHHALMTIIFQDEELKSVGDMSKESSQTVLKCFYLARIGRLDLLCTANKLARSITKWTKACDKRLNLHISETTELFIQESSGDNRSLNLHDLEFDDYTIGMALSSPLFTQEREDAASRRQAYHSLDEGSVVQSVVVCRSC